MKFLSPEAALYHMLMHGILLQAWAGATSCYLELLDKLQKRICSAVSSIELLAHRRIIASTELAQLVPLRFYPGRSIRYSDRLHDYLSPFLDVAKM